MPVLWGPQDCGSWVLTDRRQGAQMEGWRVICGTGFWGSRISLAEKTQHCSLGLLLSEKLSRNHPFHNMDSRKPMLVNLLSSGQWTMDAPYFILRGTLCSVLEQFSLFCKRGVGVPKKWSSLPGSHSSQIRIWTLQLFLEPFGLHMPQRPHHLTPNGAVLPHALIHPCQRVLCLHFAFLLCRNTGNCMKNSDYWMWPEASENLRLLR